MITIRIEIDKENISNFIWNHFMYGLEMDKTINL